MPMSSTSGDRSGYRSLAESLRTWPDERLTGLLLARPDLADPAPSDSSQLASRAATRSSLLKVLDRLTRLELAVLDALVVADHCDRDELLDLVHADRAATAEALDRLGDLALVWPSRRGLRALTGVADLLTGGPAAGVSGLQPRTADPDPVAEVARRIGEVSERARSLLRTVVDAGGTGTTGRARRTVTPAEAETPAEELLARRLLVPRGSGTVVAPGEVGLALRDGHTTTEPVDAVPGLATSERDPALVERAASGGAFEFVRRVELLGEQWGLRAPLALRKGGLGVRELRSVATDLGIDEPTAALTVEVAHAAGLLAPAADLDGNPAWTPTERYDEWTDESPAHRWLDLAAAWLASPRMPALVGRKDAAGKVWNALAPELSGLHMADTRRHALAQLAELPPGAVLAAGTGVPSLVARLEALRPRRPSARAEQAAWTVSEAAALGVTGLDGLPDYGRALVSGDWESAERELDALLPVPVDHVLIQADLTAVAPGPLRSDVARRMNQLAELESHGGAGVYRFSPASMRRALDLGWGAAEIHDFLAAVSRTPVPQPLGYLVDDTARRHGTLRAGHAAAYLRSDDESALSELLGHPRAAELGLRRLAPTVLVSSVPLDVLLPRLRELGATPVVEAEDGTARAAHVEARRARTPAERRVSPRADQAIATARAEARVVSVVASIRAGDRESAPASRGSADPASTLATLRESAQAGERVLIGFVDARGTLREATVTPVTVDGGVLLARDPDDEEQRFAVSRIRSVRTGSSA